MIPRILLPVVAALLLAPAAWAQTAQPQKITMNYPSRGAANWPLFIAKEANYYSKYGLDVNLVFGVHPAGIAMVVSSEAQMTNYTLEQAMQASSKDGSLVALGSPFKKSLFALIAAKGIGNVSELKGKRIGVSQLGDAPYNYTVGLLTRFGLTSRDVQWVPVGTDVNGRAAALTSGRVDATLLTAPVYFKLEEAGYKSLANISDYDDFYAPTVYLFKKTVVAGNPGLPELIIKAHAEAIKRFYADKQFAIQVFAKYSGEQPADIARAYDHYARINAYERVPYVLAPAVQYVLDNQSDARLAAELRKFEFRSVIDNSVVSRLVREGFFEQLFGPEVRGEQDSKARLAFGMR